jgi:hypothetical protein
MGWLGEGDRAMAGAEASRRRVAFVIVAVIGLLGAAALAARCAASARTRAIAGLPVVELPAAEAREERRVPQGGFVDGAPPADLLRGEALVPRGAKDVDGERVAPFHGFGVAVDSAPAGARVFAAGVEVGETPITASVRCMPGERVEVRVRKPGFHEWRRATRCRPDALVLLDARLARI